MSGEFSKYNRMKNKQGKKSLLFRKIDYNMIWFKMNREKLYVVYGLLCEAFSLFILGYSQETGKGTFIWNDSASFRMKVPLFYF